MVLSCRNGPGHLSFPKRTFDYSGRLARQRSNRQGPGVSASALRRARGVVVCVFPNDSRPGFCKLPSRTREQPARRRTNFLGGPIILQADIWFGVVIALHDRSLAAIRKRPDWNRE